MSLQFSSIKAVKMGEIYYYENSNAFVVKVKKELPEKSIKIYEKAEGRKDE